ncbi:MAG: hypothetical protein BM559_07010 [Roseobacter sp. MedPE-SWchi]|nr:MAG: hypothetical protein BM559_07010 [Roseobacter sp. MedPE-SWchi]
MLWSAKIKKLQRLNVSLTPDAQETKEKIRPLFPASIRASAQRDQFGWFDLFLPPATLVFKTYETALSPPF